MRTTAAIAAIAAALGLVGACAAEAAPSPTESIDCVFQGDHWNCDVPTIASADVPTAASAGVPGVASADVSVVGSADNPSVDLAHVAPSPTESIGCVAHPDYWVCDAPGPTSAVSKMPTRAPSPTESVGCTPHGNHWHCKGPAVAIGGDAANQTPDAAPSPTESVDCVAHGDDRHCDGPADAYKGAAAPSPTESTGCIQRGDYWHCDAAAPTSDSSMTTATEADPHTGANGEEPDVFHAAAPVILAYDLILHLLGLFALALAA